MKNEITYLSAVRYAIEHLSADANPAMNDAELCEELAPVIDKLNALADQLDKRAHAIRKPTAKQKQAAEARDSIPERLERGVIYTAADVGKLFGETSAWAAPKLNALVAAGVLVKTVDKRKGYYSLA